MEESSPLGRSQQSFPPAPRHVETLFSAFHQDQSHQNAAAFASQLDPSLRALDSTDAFSAHFNAQLAGTSQGQQIHVDNPFSPNPALRFGDVRSHAAVVPAQRQPQPTSAVQSNGSQFGVLTTIPQTPQQHTTFIQDDALDRALPDIGSASGQGKKDGRHFANMKTIPDPPNLDDWREKLFNVDDVITLTEDQFQTYFPHVDNIYSHRSTQRYKRKPFISHYWDCRLKGRPPGTPKSIDPSKRKRKRQARERDLCDVKIKITEYFPGAKAIMGHDFNGADDASDNFFGSSDQFGTPIQGQGQNQQFGILAPPGGGSIVDLNGSNSEKYYTIQRVNGNGGNGKGDGVPGPHKHTLEESDRVKKNSIQRMFLKEEKEKKKVQKTYHKKATGIALSTVKRHSRDHELKLFGSCFCPFVQRVWIALELKDMNYQYIEVDPYKKPEPLLEINPRGLVPSLRHGDWACHESTVLIEYLEDLNSKIPLLPQNDPQARATSRLWADHVNRKLVPAFYQLLQAQDPSDQSTYATTLKAEIATLVAAADPIGPFFEGSKMGFVDVQLAPWLLRFSRVLKPYRGWPDPEEGSRWKRWVDAVEDDVDVKATTSGAELYLDSYERYAENRPNTSQVANAVNSGNGLP